MKTIGELLTGREVLTLGPGASAADAARAMTDHHVGAVLIAAPDGQPLGIFTERDLMKRVVVVGADPAGVQLGDLMTSELFMATSDQTVTEVAQAMQDRHIRHLPVVDAKDHVMGLLSLRDLLREHLRIKAEEVQALTDYIQGAE